jgi:alpha-glucosidase
MENAQKEDFRPIDLIPMSQGTRIHQLAMLVVYESPYAQMGRNPADYLRKPEFTSFMAGIPTVWDETRVLDAKLADYLVVLRQFERGGWVGKIQR